MNAELFAPNGYDIVHWAAVVAFTFLVWEICKLIRSKIKV
jgi:hypothetical protein